LLDSGKRLWRNSSKECSFSNLQYWPARTSQRYLPSSTKRVSFSASLRRSQARISSIFDSTKSARFGLSFGGMGGSLVRKLVKHTKVFGSWPANQSGFNQFRFIQAKPYIRTAAAGVLGEADAAMGQKLG